VEHQLMLLLKYLLTEGSGASNLDLQSMFRIATGTCQLYKNRVVKAIRSHCPQAITWPDPIKRLQIAEPVQQ
jgi:hypothetical protein